MKTPGFPAGLQKDKGGSDSCVMQFCASALRLPRLLPESIQSLWVLLKGCGRYLGYSVISPADSSTGIPSP